MGKPSINGPFSIAMLNNQMVIPISHAQIPASVPIAALHPARGCRGDRTPRKEPPGKIWDRKWGV